MRPELIKLIGGEIANAKEGKPAGIWAKMNALVDPAKVLARIKRTGQVRYLSRSD